MIKKALLAAALLAASSGLATAADLQPFYTKQCWTAFTPADQAVLSTKGGALLWNGDPFDWEMIQSFLADIPRAMKTSETGNMALTVDEMIPHRKEILDILAKQGLTLHYCEPLHVIP